MPYKDSFKEAAKVAVRRGIEAGRLVRPETCERCGERPPKGKDGRSLIQGHHHDHAKQLDVEWICTKCHFKETPHVSVCGSKSHFSSLTEDQALAIFNDERNYRVIAREYGVTKTCTYNIKKGLTWSWLTGARQAITAEKQEAEG